MGVIVSVGRSFSLFILLSVLLSIFSSIFRIVVNPTDVTFFKKVYLTILLLELVFVLQLTHYHIVVNSKFGC